MPGERAALAEFHATFRRAGTELPDRFPGLDGFLATPQAAELARAAAAALGRPWPGRPRRPWAVAAELGNTPAVCRKSYIHPRVIDAFLNGVIPGGRAVRGLSSDEARVLRLLEE